MTPPMSEYEAQSVVVAIEIVTVGGKRLFAARDSPYLLISKFFEKVKMRHITVVIVNEEIIFVR